MQIITLYKTYRASGGVDVSPKMPETDNYDTLYRLVADEGCVLVDSNGNRCECIDVDDPEQWHEIPDEDVPTEE